MRTLLLCSFMLLIPLILYPQDEGKKFQKFKTDIQKEFDEDLEKQQNEYSVFIDSINKDYTNSILEAEKEFSALLQESFREFNVMQADEKTENTKPAQLPEYKITPQENVLTQLNERNISFRENQGILLPLKSVNSNVTGLTHKASFHFLGNFFTVDFDANISQLPDMLKTDATTIKKSYDFLRKTNYPFVLDQFAEISRQMNLNDWDYYCLISEFSKSVTDKTCIYFIKCDF